MKKFIALYRVSTGKQGDSGLGLEAQKFSVTNYLSSCGHELIEEVIEIESASNKDRINTKNRKLDYDTMLNKRPKLKYIIEKAEKEGLTIIVKEPSRLTRFSILMGLLIEYKIPFICSDCPNDDSLMIKLRTLFNEEENLRRSERTKLALDAKRARGEKLGNVKNLSNIGRNKGAKVMKDRASNDIRNVQAIDKIKDLVGIGGITMEGIAVRLNEARYQTTAGKAFDRFKVSRLINKI